jgi:hypothetical protein
MDAAGNLYGTTHGRGTLGGGTVFLLTRQTTTKRPSFTTSVSLEGFGRVPGYSWTLMDGSVNLSGIT